MFIFPLSFGPSLLGYLSRWLWCFLWFLNVVGYGVAFPSYSLFYGPVSSAMFFRSPVLPGVVLHLPVGSLLRVWCCYPCLWVSCVSGCGVVFLNLGSSQGMQGVASPVFLGGLCPAGCGVASLGCGPSSGVGLQWVSHGLHMSPGVVLHCWVVAHLLGVSCVEWL